MDKLVYLAGPIDGETYNECTEWREYAIKELSYHGITGLSPMRAKDFLKDHPLMREGISDSVLTTDGAITIRDMWDVRRCDAVLFNLLKAKKVSIGTMIEYGWASAFNKPIITMMETRDGITKNVHEHAMIRRLSAYRVNTLEEGLYVVKTLFDY
ncbi:MAG: nucleoside 2-deoxyribosyltransferase [Nanoarchaeota archaeon]|nr:nucleoside 2-deoxyribosyltransferase [Nanoarchaeota archaeon]